MECGSISLFVLFGKDEIIITKWSPIPLLLFEGEEILIMIRVIIVGAEVTWPSTSMAPAARIRSCTVRPFKIKE